MKKIIYIGLIGLSMGMMSCNQDPDRYDDKDESAAGDIEDADNIPENQSDGHGTSNGYDDDTTENGEIEHEHE